MDWDDLKILHAIARSGSLSAAARALGVSQPTVSRRLGCFEHAIGTKLFDRHSDGLSPTALTQALIEGLERMEEGALSVERKIVSRDTGLQGAISVTSLDWLGDYVIAPLTARFGARHPRVDIELLNDVRVFNLSRLEADIAFRFSAFRQENLVSRRVGEVAYGLYASPDYLRTHGWPNFEDGCRGHAIILLQEGPGEVCYREWLKALAPRARVIMRTNGIQSHVMIVESGEAMAVLPRVVADRRSTVCRVDAPRPDPVQPVRIGFHADMRHTPRIRAFVDFAVSEFDRRAAELNPNA